MVVVVADPGRQSPSVVNDQPFQTPCREGSRFSRFIEHVSTLLTIECDFRADPSFGGHPALGLARHSLEGGIIRCAAEMT